MSDCENKSAAGKLSLNQSAAVLHSSGSSGRASGRGAEKHEIYVAAFGSHLFYDLFLQGRGSHGPPPDPLLITIANHRCIGIAKRTIIVLSI